MNHQIEDGPNVSAAARVGAVPFRFDKQRRKRTTGQIFKGRVEAFDMSDLEGHTSDIGKRDQVVGLGDGAADGLFHQNRYATTEKLRRDGMVIHRRSDDADRVNRVE